ncbi:hypothetical protein ACG94X_14080 [Acinetobacter sp. ULE_I010]|uniref:hypothetical protein n=1 Tax=Acinetobacter sp. ULE_I010 TaxID=3373065 RepID=UPI003AF76E37
MSQGIPARDMIVDRNGQITTVWLIFFERLYSVYSDSSQNNTESIAQIKKIADRALELAQQAKKTSDAQQKQINDLHTLITDSVQNFATSNDINSVNKRIEQTEHDFSQLEVSFGKLQKAFDALQKESGVKFKGLQDQINNLARSSFVEAPIDGKTYGRKDLEWSEIVAVKLSLPFFLSDGSQQNLELTPNYFLPFFLSNGVQQDIQMVTT